MNRSFSSATQVSFHGIGKVSFADQKTCQASLRSILSDIYPVQTIESPLPLWERVRVRGLSQDRSLAPSARAQEGEGGRGECGMGEKRLGVIMNGVTGRMGTNQHLVRSILAIRAQGGTVLADGTRIVPDPILVGRNAEKLALLAEQHGVARITTDLDRTLADP